MNILTTLAPMLLQSLLPNLLGTDRKINSTQQVVQPMTQSTTNPMGGMLGQLLGGGSNPLGMILPMILPMLMGGSKKDDEDGGNILSSILPIFLMMMMQGNQPQAQPVATQPTEQDLIWEQFKQINDTLHAISTRLNSLEKS